VSDEEVHRVVEALKSATPPNYVEEVLSGPSMPIPGMPDEDGEGGSRWAATPKSTRSTMRR
jgi:S-DNA-T family DNA segregation ATPase FtsK/SpoIIIE